MITEAEVIALLRLLPSQASVAGDTSFVRTYVSWAYHRTDAPLVFALPAALNLLSTNAPIQLCAFNGGRIHANTWGMIVGLSGWGRKTTAVEMAMDVQRGVDSTKIGSEPASPEALDLSLSEYPQQSLYYEEMGDFLARSHDGYYRAIREKLTKSYDCPPINKRSAKAKIEVPNPRLSILGGVTPSYLETWTNENDWQGGFLGRWAVFYGQVERFYPRPQPAHELYEWLVARMQQLAQHPAGPCAGMTPGAAALWDTWSLQMRNSSINAAPWVASASARTGAVALKAAILLAHDAQRTSEAPWWLDEECVNAGIAIAQVHFRSLCYIVNELSGSKYGRERRNVIRAMDRTDERRLTLRKILNRTSPRLEKRDLARVLETLIEDGTVYKASVGGAELWSLDPFEKQDPVI
jgi:hypothetical protein